MRKRGLAILLTLAFVVSLAAPIYGAEGPGPGLEPDEVAGEVAVAEMEPVTAGETITAENALSTQQEDERAKQGMAELQTGEVPIEQTADGYGEVTGEIVVGAVDPDSALFAYLIAGPVPSGLLKPENECRYLFYIDDSYILNPEIVEISFDGEYFHCWVNEEARSRVGDGVHSVELQVYTIPWSYKFEFTGTFETSETERLGRLCKRFYTQCLNRTGTDAEVEYWADRLLSGEKDLADMVEYFFFGPEFTMANHSDEEFIDIVYKALLGREADAAGLAYWARFLKEGVSRRGILSAFIDMPEFESICRSYGVYSGYLYMYDVRDYSRELTRYVYRMYKEVLGREAEAEGQRFWCEEMLFWDMSPYQLASNFVFSEEFIAQNHSNESFVTVLYRAFMGREPEADGYNYWVEQLNTGARDWRDVFDGFATSQEFMEISAGFRL